MNGVEILTSSEVVANTMFNWKAFWIIFAISFFVIFLISIFIKLVEDLEWFFIPIFTIAVGLIGGVLFGGLFGGTILATPSEYETQYKVTISDEVSMNEFNEKYEIIDKEGKIYTVREKD